MLITTLIETGDLKGAIYDFPEINDILPMHEHTPNDVHITIICKGSFKVHGNGWDKKIKAGDILDWNPYDPHEFISLEENSRLVNIVKKFGGILKDTV